LLVGFYRDLIFIVQKGLTQVYALSFSNLNRTMGANWATHPSINGLERIEKTGDKLQDMRLSILLTRSTWVSPELMIDRLEGYRNDGKSGRFVMGFRPVGRREWVVTNVGAAYNIIKPGGIVHSATVDVTFKEYY